MQDVNISKSSSSTSPSLLKSASLGLWIGGAELPCNTIVCGTVRHGSVKVMIWLTASKLT